VPETVGGLTVPYITLWSGERKPLPPLVRRVGRGGEGIGYLDEFPYERGELAGELWVRQALARGVGVPEFAAVHARRQRRAMRYLLCQVCGRPARAGEDEPVLFLLSGTAPVAEGERTDAPPVCVACAPIAVRQCPRLRKAHTAVWVGYPFAWGVAGVLCDLDTFTAIPGDDLVEVAYEDPRIRRLIACREVLALCECTPADIADLTT